MSLSRSLKRRQYFEGKKITEDEIEKIVHDPIVPPEFRDDVRVFVSTWRRKPDVHKK